MTPKTDAKICGMGHSMKRKEDPRFIRGQGRYVDDIQLPEMRSSPASCWISTRRSRSWRSRCSASRSGSPPPTSSNFASTWSEPAGRSRHPGGPPPLSGTNPRPRRRRPARAPRPPGLGCHRHGHAPPGRPLRARRPGALRPHRRQHRQGDVRPARERAAAARRLRRRRPRPARGSPRHRQDDAREGARDLDRRALHPRAVHARPAALRHPRRVGLQPEGAGVRVPRRAGVHEHPARRRDQPRLPAHAVGPPRGDGRAAGLGRGTHASAWTSSSS